ncbi:hypothetical protein QEH52_19425 [Coraliomargarita sp. SDUM461003]|uniref:Uncharacterized protein n=1 Tax=Thalassobacterium maritimum TaxID=3041265 RepID=A0ABU1AZY1_9BACT|nr:hypothetical protein [Coraliomargarita sp. SDUM461003]MDQ8209698.1 hypothetical protein [Coraliomargarita sp. SDUM461003]
MKTKDTIGFLVAIFLTILSVILLQNSGKRELEKMQKEISETVLEKTVTNNLRIIASLADQYFLEAKVDSIRLDQLIKTKEDMPLIKIDSSVIYPDIIRRNDSTLSATLSNGDEISINYNPIS